MQRFSMRFPACFQVFTAVLVVLVAAAAGWAADGWWNTGKKLLQGLGQNTAPAGISTAEIGAGLKEALRVGVGDVVTRLGRTDGFNADDAVHIPLPAAFQTARDVLERVGMAGMLNDLELKLNRAAESATPRVKALFWDAIAEMTLSDIQGIYQGPEDAATRYFQGKMTPALAESMRPVVSDTLSQVGAVRSYNTLMGRYKSIPFVPDLQADLTGHVVEKGMDGIFHYLAREEAAIRKDPAKRTTELLKKVFGR